MREEIRLGDFLVKKASVFFMDTKITGTLCGEIKSNSEGLVDITIKKGMFGYKKIKVTDIPKDKIHFYPYGESCANEAGTYVILPTKTTPLEHSEEFRILNAELEFFRKQYNDTMQELHNFETMVKSVQRPEKFIGIYNASAKHFETLRKAVSGRGEHREESLALEQFKTDDGRQKETKKDMAGR